MESFKINKKMKEIVVIGDVMLDKYIYGEINRLNPEAPVPVLDVTEKIYSLGGAANVANNIKSFGESPYLIGYVGGDSAGRVLKEKLKVMGISNKMFRTAKTTTKTRFGSPQMLRVDEEESVKKNFDLDIIKIVRKLNPKIIVISDYSKGAVTQRLYDGLKRLNIRIIVNPKPKSKVNYSGCYLVTPNLKESKELKGRFRNVLITEDAQGMSLGNMHFPTEAKEVYDITGAGDTVIAALSVKLLHGDSLIDSIIFANKMAGKVVSKRGTSVVNEKIVFTNGCFDIFHLGHIQYLREAKKLGYLIVGVNTDNSIKRIKEEPIIKQEDRIEMLKSLGFIDEIILFDENTPIKLIRKIRPSIYVKGGDNVLKKIDKDIRRFMGDKRIIIIPQIKNISSTEIKNKIKNNY